MRRSLLLLLIGSGIATAIAGVPALIAQTADGIDVEAVKKRAAAVQDDAAAFVQQVQDRGRAMREEAEQVRVQGTEAMRRVAADAPPTAPTAPRGPIDLDTFVAGAAANANVARGTAPQLIVFASLSMPKPSLKALISDTARAGGVVVFRGFPDNSARAFSGAIAGVVGDGGDASAIGIDPRLFRAFAVQAVPTYVVVSSDFDLCDGFDCSTAVPPYDRMVGNVTLDHALSTFVDANGPGARVAAVALTSLRGVAK